MRPLAHEIQEQLDSKLEPIEDPDLDWPEPKSTTVTTTVVSRTTRQAFTLEEDWQNGGTTEILENQ